jgi:hypothetical protein
MIETEETPEDRELGKILSRSRGNRYDATKDLYFEKDPETAALHYPFDKRSIEILGADKWRQLFSSDED